MDTSKWAVRARDVSVSYKCVEYGNSATGTGWLGRWRRRAVGRSIHALQGVSFEVAQGQTLGLIGHNGSGKSTLLKVIAGIIEPEGCILEVNGRVAPMIELGAGFDPELSGRENIVLACAIMGLTSREISTRLDQIIDYAELREFIDMPLKNFSSGMQARLGFACATTVDPDILLIDEVLAVGDSNFAQKCHSRMAQLKQEGTTIILVSHSPELIEAFCDSAMVLNEGRMVLCGTVAEARRVYDRLMEQRMLQALPEEQRKEHLRKMKLIADAQKQALGTGAPIPTLEVDFAFHQNGGRADEPDVAQAFRLIFNLKIADPGRFEDGVAFGIAFLTDGRVRIGGCNNHQCRQFIALDLIRRARRAQVCFDFSEGLPELGAGTYRLAFAVLDRQLTRTVKYLEFDNQIVHNSHQSGPLGVDILQIHTALTGMQIEFSSHRHTVHG